MHRNNRKSETTITYQAPTVISYLFRPHEFSQLSPAARAWNRHFAESHDRSLSEERMPHLEIKAHIDVGPGNALYVTGSHPLLGGWKRAKQLVCVQSDMWELRKRLSEDLNGTTFKFMIGPHSAGDDANISELTYEIGGDRKLTDKYFNITKFETTLTLDNFPEYINNQASCKMQ